MNDEEKKVIIELNKQMKNLNDNIKTLKEELPFHMKEESKKQLPLWLFAFGLTYIFAGLSNIYVNEYAYLLWWASVIIGTIFLIIGFINYKRFP